MDYKISMSEDKSYVVIRVYIPTTRSLAFEFNQKMIKQAQVNGINKFLFDMRKSANTETTFGNYFIAYKDAEKVDFKRTAQFAVLHDINDKSHDFIMTVAKNAGYNLMLFIKEQDATEWLS